jgi:chemosensory pili system protein ChpA (sensor histidine kinase/response regulator)
MATILLVDDDPTLQVVMQQMLEAGDHAVLTARVGHALLEDLQSLRYDVVVTDLHMPTLDGWDVATWLRERRSGTRVIAVGGDVSGGRDAPMEIFDAVLAKPFRRQELLDAVAEVISRPAERHRERTRLQK